jgi:hypothetical protein
MFKIGFPHARSRSTANLRYLIFWLKVIDRIQHAQPATTLLRVTG